MSRVAQWVIVSDPCHADRAAAAHSDKTPLFRSRRSSFFRTFDNLLFGALNIAWQHFGTLLSASRPGLRIGQLVSRPRELLDQWLWRSSQCLDGRKRIGFREPIRNVDAFQRYGIAAINIWMRLGLRCPN
jgi:hypothetical protein